MTLVVGVDPSSRKLAFVITDTDGGYLAEFTHVLPQRDVIKRCGEAYDVTLDFAGELARDHPLDDVYVFIEAPVLGRGGARSTIEQSKVHGCVVAAFHNSGVCETVKVVNNSQWKKKIVGKGNASKAEVQEWARVYWRNLYDIAHAGKPGGRRDQDVIDAGAINRFGITVVEMMVRLENHRAKSRTVKKKPLLKRKKK